MILYTCNPAGHRVEFTYKKLFIKEHQIKVVFRCCFTSYNFTFNMDLFEYANSSLKGTTIIWETPPHYLCFYKDININHLYLLLMVDIRYGKIVVEPRI